MVLAHHIDQGGVGAPFQLGDQAVVTPADEPDRRLGLHAMALHRLEMPWLAAGHAHHHRPRRVHRLAQHGQQFGFGVVSGHGPAFDVRRQEPPSWRPVPPATSLAKRAEMAMFRALAWARLTATGA